MSSTNPPGNPKKAARKTRAKVKGPYVTDTAGIINVAGEVFVLNTNL